MKLESLRMVLDLEQRREDEAAREFGRVRHQFSLQERRLSGLETYRSEYLTQANQRATVGMGSVSFGHYHAFVGKLDVGISQQREALYRLEKELEEVRQHWLHRQQRRKAIEFLLEQREQEIDKVRRRQEQRNSDEFAMQGFLRRAREQS
ncbi:MAG: flagellar export protein FliJ [Idiomarina sp.]|nr:flagellar export protein FliJ [Idiomarina sp.]